MQNTVIFIFNEVEQVILMHSKYFLMSPLQKRRGMPIYTQQRKTGTSNLRDEYKKREIP